MPEAAIVNAEAAQGGLRVRAYQGDGAILLAFDVDASQTQGLAGFAVFCTPEAGKPYWLPNRLSFTTQVTSDTTAETRTWTPSNEAPFQKFWWADFPRQGGKCVYEVTAMYHDGDGLKAGPKASAEVQVGPYVAGDLKVGFTRGYISSQAYAAEFKNAPILPAGGKTVDFDTTPFAQQYAWLGANARKLVFDALSAAIADPAVTVDLFAYDLDEPDFIRALTQLGDRLRAVLDNAPLHQGATAIEPKAAALLQGSAGDGNVVIGHFSRFSHDKVMIFKRGGAPFKVLTGSANFSIRGLYVQANSVLVFEEPQTAALYEAAFEEAFSDHTHTAAFTAADISKQWFDLPPAALPPASVGFAPHASASVSLDRVAASIKAAKSSVLFAIMGLDGGGPVIDAVKNLPGRQDLFSYGVSETKNGLDLYKPGAANTVGVTFGTLSKLVPANFRQEWDGGRGQHIHHKFVVVDWNGDNPIAYMGSSNLAAGGETSNGDNLIEVRDPGVAQVYGIEAIRLIDHYHFRASITAATAAKPLTLDATDHWWQAYFDPTNVKCRSRQLFAQGAAG
ncbi:MAG TPA: phospholipase [Thermoanaerobaculia bacterium]|jgi:hypothetical protein